MLRHETALGSRWNDHGVFHDLGFHEPQDLCAKIFPAIGPSDTATRNISAAQVDALYSGRINKYFELGPGQRHFGQMLRIQLDRDIRLVFTGVVVLKVIGSQGRGDGT